MAEWMAGCLLVEMKTEVYVTISLSLSGFYGNFIWVGDIATQRWEVDGKVAGRKKQSYCVFK